MRTLQEIDSELKACASKAADLMLKIHIRKTALAEAGISHKADNEYHELTMEQLRNQTHISELKAEKAALPKAEPKPVIAHDQKPVSAKTQYTMREFVRLLRQEIGQERYDELHRQAEAAAEEHCCKEKATKDVNFAKMMRNNYNRFGGDNL